MALEASIRIIYDRRKKASATVKGGVEIEVYYNRQRIRFASGVNVLKQHWKGGMVVSHPKAQELNEQIISLYETIDQRITTMRRRGVIDLNLLKEAKVEEENNSSNFLDWLEDRIYKRDIKESTRRQHFVMLGELCKSHITIFYSPCIELSFASTVGKGLIPTVRLLCSPHLMKIVMLNW